MDKIHLYMASLPDRRKTLIKSLNSLIEQVDTVQIAVNYDLDPLQKNLARAIPNVKFIEHDNSLQDGARFINANAKPGYCLVCDDDIFYPPDFVQTMINWHTVVGGFVTVMGKVLKPRPLQSYYKGWAANYRTFDKIDQLQRVDIPGCCGILWHTKEVTVNESNMIIPNSDVCVGALAKELSIPCHVVPHAADWLTNLMPELPKDTLSIFGKYRKNDKIQTDYINKWM
jgi:hypothetical protein